MDDARRKLVRRVINLSQVCSENATPGEVENAERIGVRLVERHGISHAECQAVYAEDLEAERVRLGRRPSPPPERDFGEPPPPADPFFDPFGSATAGASMNGEGWTVFVTFS